MRKFVYAILQLLLLSAISLSNRNIPSVNADDLPPYNWTDISLREVFMLGTDDVWAVGGGSSDRIIRWNGSIWQTIQSPTGSWLNSMFMLSATDGWAAGSDGTIIRWNGTDWSIVSSPTASGLYGMSMVDSSDGWAVGWAGLIIRWNGTGWNTFTSPTSWLLFSVCMVNASDGWAVGSAGTIIRWNGTGWRTVTSPTTSTLHGVFMVNATYGWTVGSNGIILHWNGTEWNTFTSPTTQSLRSVFMVNATDGWAVGDPGTIIKWNGTGWSTWTSPTMQWLFSVHMIASNDGWAVGDFGEIIHWNGTEWSRSTTSIHQGDLIINGDDVFVIEDIQFDINGSIIVEENATLILRNAIVNFLQAEDYQFNMTFRNAANGNPRLLVENTSINSNGHYLITRFYENSSALIDELGPSWELTLYILDSSTAFVSNSAVRVINTYGNSTANVASSDVYAHHAHDNSRLNVANGTVDILTSWQNSTVKVTNSTITSYVTLYTRSVDCSLAGIKPGFFGDWNFIRNCSVVAGLNAWAPNLTLTNTEVELWSFSIAGFSNVTIPQSDIYFIYIYDSTTVWSQDSIFGYDVKAYDNSKFHAFNSTINRVYSYENNDIWFTNSTANQLFSHDNSFATITSDSLIDTLVSYDSSTVNASHSKINEIVTRQSSVVNVSSSNVDTVGTQESSQVHLSNCALKDLHSYESSLVHASDSTIDALLAYGESTVWLTNSTYSSCGIHNQSEVYMSWNLDAHVVDSIDQDVPSASVTAYYPNATIAELKLTDENGWTRLTLLEKMMNATGEYPIGNYAVEAIYDIHSDSTPVNLTENKHIILQLSFIIPEFSSLTALLLLMIASLLAVIIYNARTKKYSPVSPPGGVTRSLCLSCPLMMASIL